MAEPVNLNRFRKRKERAAKKARADENAILHGRSKAEKDLDRARNKMADRDLDGHEREE